MLVELTPSTVHSASCFTDRMLSQPPQPCEERAIAFILTGEREAQSGCLAQEHSMAHQKLRWMGTQPCTAPALVLA